MRHDNRDRTGASDRGGQPLWRRRLRHDIRHELGTIIMLASAVVVAEDVGDTSRARIDQLLGETRWLDHLLRRLDEDDDHPVPAPERIRVDGLTAEVVTGMRLVTPHEIRLTAGEAWAHMDPVSLWRAVRNVLENACRAAEGRVDVHVEAAQGRLVIQVDDDGPGFGASRGAPAGRPPARPGLASLGLGIVHDLISGYGGTLEIRTCEMGGARVRMVLPAAPPPEDRAAAALADAHSDARSDAHSDDWRPYP
ncbi:sensor histidine kinase [Actinomadura mexicana]|uniref:sensor histidine kinase n=1 Tax=Actinomadura mexicana TaxID=134959 RepID=UPI0015C68C4D|nr:ATP-binding protein [Actinomadura mexicana]